MAEPNEPDPASADLRQPPTLPKRLADPWPVAFIGTGIWVVSFVVVIVVDRHASMWVWTTLAGTALGLIGIAIMLWQRTAARKGSKGAQSGI